MNSFLRPYKNKKGRRGVLGRRALTTIFLLIGALGALHFTLPYALSGISHATARPLWVIERAVAGYASEKLALLQSKQTLVSQNRELSRRLAYLSEVRETRVLLQEENRRLKSLLGRSEYPARTLAAVLVRPSASLYDTFVIDIGTRQGADVGDKVVAFGDTIVGSVSKVFQNSALVTLFSSPKEETAILLGPSRVSAVAEGRGGGNFTARLPRDVDIAEGDTITMPGINPVLFGIVEKIIEHPTDPFQTILFKNPINLNEIEWVEVIIASPHKQNGAAL